MLRYGYVGVIAFVLLAESSLAFVLPSFTPTSVLHSAGHRAYTLPSLRRVCTQSVVSRLFAVSSEVSEVLSKFGVPPEKHEALVSELAPLLSKPQSGKSSKVDVEVVRNEAGGLGIDVDQENVIRGNAGQPNLKVGDRIVSVDGEQLAGRAVAEVLTPGKGSYTFTVMRGVESAQQLEDKLSLLAADEEMFAGANGLSGQDPSKNVKQFVSAAEKLEQLCVGFGDAELKGFWKLAYTNDVTFVSGGGSSGLAAMPYCSLAAHWQCYQDKDPVGQTVEVVANANLGKHSIAALKGTWTVGPQEAVESEAGGVRRTVQESYKRLEYGGSPQGGKGIERTVTVTYAGKGVKICRKAGQLVDEKGEVKAGEGVYVYLKKAGGDVQSQIQQWMEKDVPGAGGAKKRWETTPGKGGGPENQSMLRD